MTGVSFEATLEEAPRPGTPPLWGRDFGEGAFDAVEQAAIRLDGAQRQPV